MVKEIQKYNSRVTIYGNTKQVEEASKNIEELNLSGKEQSDRLIIQQCIDDNNIKASILYNGNIVYPYKKIVNDYRKLQKTNSLEKMTLDLYHFFMNACGDIAHYNFNGYKSYYNYSLRNLEDELLSKNIHVRNADVEKIFKTLKIGKYYNERELAIEKTISMYRLKKLIGECGCTVIDKEDMWILNFDSPSYGFSVDIVNRNSIRVLEEIKDYCLDFDEDEYIDKKVAEREKESNPRTIRQIVEDARGIKFFLRQLADNLDYNYKLEVDLFNTKSNENNLDFEIEK